MSVVETATLVQPQHHHPRVFSGSPPTPIAKTYRQAVQLFLTRRLPEALSTIEPILTPTIVLPDESGKGAAGAPIATASRGTRIKIWTFYLTFLNSLIELGPEEGKHAFGGAKWKSTVAKVRDGSVWEEIVQTGYGGVEGDVDMDVVINLATLLVTHAYSQKLTQQRLENYLAASDLEDSPYSHQGLRSPVSTPRYSHTCLRLVEIYTLHVLPRNQEWDYAREYVGMSQLLDNEQKEAFLLALHELRQGELKQEQEELERQEALRKRREAESRRIYSEGQKRAEQSEIAPQKKRTAVPVPPRSALRNSRTVKRSPQRPAVPAKRDSTFAYMIRTYIGNTWTSSPLFRAVLVASCVLLALGRRDLRQILTRILQIIWSKIRQTIGMGVKVSYI